MKPKKSKSSSVALPSTKLDSAQLRKYILIFLALGLVSFFLIDKYLAERIANVGWLAHHRQMFVFYLFDELGRAKDWTTGSGIVLIVSSFFLYLKKGNKRRQHWVRYSGRLFLAVFLASMVSDTLKTLVGRYRPYNVTPDSEITFRSFQLFQGGYNKLASFPSSHAAMAMAVAMTFYYIKPQSPYNKYIFVMAFLVMAQRLATMNHYFSDVVIGAGIGFVAAYLGAWFWKNFIKVGE